MLTGPLEIDKAKSESFIESAKQFGLKIIDNRNFLLGNDPRARDQNDLDFLESNGLRFDHILSRKNNDMTADHILKYDQLKKFLKDNPYLNDKRKIMYDDSLENLQEISKLKIEGRLAWTS